jgi:tRNA U38,U39,U40 pseudouridine synthase TruA
MKVVSKDKSNSIKVFSEDFKKSKVNELLEKRITVSWLIRVHSRHSWPKKKRKLRIHEYYIYHVGHIHGGFGFAQPPYRQL